MGGILLAAWLGTASAQTVCASREDALSALEETVVTVDLSNVQRRIDDVVAAMGCGGAATPRELARLWNAEGAYLIFEGDQNAAEDSFQAARRVDRDHWTEAFGGKLRAVWEDAPEATDRGTVAVDPAPTWWVTVVDAEVVPVIPHGVPNGLHLIQGGPAVNDIRFAKLVYVRPGGVAVAVHDEKEGPAPVREDAAVAEAKNVDPQPRWTAQTAAGAGFAFGRAARNEPAAKVPFALEVSVIGRLPTKADGPRSLWVRGGVAALPLVGGQWSFDGTQGPTDAPNALGAHAAVGGRTPQGDVGGLLGYQWPGRVQLRILAALELGKLPMAIEPRVGLNVGQGAEPAIEVLFAYRPPLIW